MGDSGFAVSARKFRPQTFSELIGQPHIVQTLSNALDKNRIAHAYLFTGTRGVGKTTTARILAKALNCVEGPTSRPCLECAHCKEIAAGTSIDVQEIDGASNSGVENIRELREKVRFAPASSRYKIYIIDEVHQISKHAFNALLKTLEEPPDHVIFIFATTELHKVPDTILSRCQSFEYKSISQADIATQLAMVAKVQEVDITEGAIRLLTRRARGSMRDAQSLFDQTAAYGGGSVTEEDVQLILGMVDKKFIYDVMDAVVSKDQPGVMEQVEKISRVGSDPALFVEELAETVRDIMVMKLRPDTKSGLTTEEREKLMAWAETLEIDDIQRYFETLTRIVEQMKRSHLPTMNLEMGLLRMTEERGATSVEELIDRVARAETVIEKRVAATAPPPAYRATSVESAPVSSTPDESPPLDVAILDEKPQQAPPDLIEAFKKEKPALIGVFVHATVEVKEEAIIVSVGSLFDQEQLAEKEILGVLEEIASRHMGKKMRLVVKLDAPQKKKSSPEERQIKERETQRTSRLRNQLMEAPIIQSALEIFNADIVEITVEKGH